MQRWDLLSRPWRQRTIGLSKLPLRIVTEWTADEEHVSTSVHAEGHGEMGEDACDHAWIDASVAEPRHLRETTMVTFAVAEIPTSCAVGMTIALVPAPPREPATLQHAPHE